MAQTNLMIKILLCLILPAYHTLQHSNMAGGGSNNTLAIFRYWLVLSLVFLSELFLDQLNLSPGFTILKLAFMFWCVAPIEYNGSHVIYDKIISPFFKVSKSWLGDLVQTRILDEMTETLQDFINMLGDKIPKLSNPPAQTYSQPRKPKLFKHYLSLHQENITAFIVYLQ